MPMHIIVCVKSVVRTAPKGVARRTPENSELNPFDRPALEAALQIKNRTGASVTALSMGPPVAGEALAEAMAMGVDRAVLISDRALAESDTLATSRVLVAAIRKIGAFDLLLFGTRTADSDTGQVGPQTAALLDIPFVSGVRKIESENQGWTMQRTMDGWQESWQAATPAAATIDPRAFTPRPISLQGVALVYEQPAVERMALDDLGLAADEAGLAGSPTRVAALEKVARKRRCTMLEGEPQKQVEELLERLTRAGLVG